MRLGLNGFPKYGASPLFLVVWMGLLLNPFRPSLHAATPPGTIIENVAEVLDIAPSGATTTYYSNTDRFEVAELAYDEPARFLTYRIDPAGAPSGIIPLASFRDPNSTGDSLVYSFPDTIPEYANVLPSTTFRSGELVLLEIRDFSRNKAPDRKEAVAIRLYDDSSGDSEVLELSETGPNTGRFAAFIRLEQSRGETGDGLIYVASNSKLKLEYLDTEERAIQLNAEVFVDPQGALIDSATGDPIDGISLTLVDDSTGLPAEVFGNDGFTPYPSTVVSGEDVTDAGGTVYSIEPGRYIFPVVSPGRYRLELDLPEESDYSFPSTLSDAQLIDVTNGSINLAEGSRGEAFWVGSDPTNFDLPLDPNPSDLAISLQAMTPSAGQGDFVPFQIEVFNNRTTQPFRNVDVLAALPVGFHLDEASLTIDGESAQKVSAADGRTFVVPVTEILPGQSARIAYLARVGASRPGQATSTAIAEVGTIQTNTASATVEILDELMTSRSHILGRVSTDADNETEANGLAGVAIYLETGSMTLTDQRGYFRFEGVTPGTHVVQLDLETLPSGAQLLPQGNDRRSNARPHARVVELAPGSLWQVNFLVSVAERPDYDSFVLEEEDAIVDNAPTFPAKPSREWIDQQPVAFDWVYPSPDFAAPTPATKVLIQHSPAHTVKLTLDGEPVSPLNFDGKLTNSAGTLCASLWSGINLKSGTQVLEAVWIDSFGIERDRQTRNLFYANPPVRLELVPEQSILKADGTTPPVVAVRLLDRDGHPASPDISGRIDVAPPYAAWRPDTLRELQIVPGSAPETDRYIVGEDGIALIKLDPTTITGTAVLNFHLVTGPHEIRADLRGDRKEWIIVGIAEGSTGYDLVRDHVELGTEDDGIDIEDDTKGRIALFAKGRIKGGWLLTAAYDSEREVVSGSRTLHNGINPDAFYTVYGDESTRLENAPTSEKLYVKLERNAVTALFGDYRLDWTTTPLTTYNRELHGAKVDYRGETVRLSGFQSDAGLSFTRDEIRGDGLSGPYALSRSDIVPFSENVTLELRDPIRHDIVLAEEQLTRNFDYSIDYRTGEIRLAEPLYPTDRNQRHQYLVVQYELEDRNAGTVLGGRAEYLFDDQTSVGATYLSEEHDGATSTLSGVDARVRLDNGFSAEAEYAVSRKAGESSEAINASVSHRTETSDTRFYFLETGEDFGLGQLNRSQLDNRQIGFDGSHRFTNGLSVRESVFQEVIPSTGDQRQSAEAQLEWNSQDWTTRAGFKGAKDKLADGSQNESILGTAGILRRLHQNRLEIYADREQSLSGEADNLDYPERTRVGAAYKLTPESTVFTEHEWTTARERKTEETRIGMESNPWTGGHFVGGMMQRQSFTPSVSLGAGFDQKLQLTPQLEVSGGYERGKVVSGEPTRESSQSPFHSPTGFSKLPQGNNSAAFAGAEWRKEEILYLGRIETSLTESGRRSGFLASAQSEPHANLGLVASLIGYSQAPSSGGTTTNIDARFGTAWRPQGGNTIILNRFDLVRSNGGSAAGLQWKAIENLHWNRDFERYGQVSVHLGLKYTEMTFDERSYDSFVSFTGIEWRRNLTPNWDIGLHTGALSSWQDGTHRTRLGLSIGRSFADGIWVSTGYNFAGFEDTDFSGARQSESGVFIKFRLQFDQQSMERLLRAIREE